MNKRRYGRPRGLPYRAERCEQTHVQTNTRPARAGIESRGELAAPSGGILRALFSSAVGRLLLLLRAQATERHTPRRSAMHR